MIIRRQAEADLADARAWYEGQREALGEEFLECVDEALKQIELMPEIRGPVYRDVRRALIRRFPFAVYYRIHAEEVVVIAVVHSRRDPRSWKSRG